ncbi:murein transglycosylase [Phyllobacterium salinisoli]|uniref:Murein transglycosylase n=1 Tax=Phyllobacterium salinisoli TaxID=1899321 RepID=A0A368K2I1_9HYPH|nr:lytic transglycosylase domain-containing protein [Phyllobacterium salinisoli]RCS23609.1 murein transglycosylase [Phyllobacterium salinisoli]
MALLAKSRSKMAVALVILATGMLAATGNAEAASCGNNAAGYTAWVQQFKQEAAARGISGRALNALDETRYATKTISADRNQKSFKLSLDQFMQKRGGQAIINRGKSIKKQNAKLFASLEQRYGVPAGPLIAIWGMETGFGNFLGNQNTLSAVATLAYDCRRSAYFTEQLYAALKLIDRGDLSPSAIGAAHGEIGQTQFLPANVLKFGVDGDGNGHIDMARSKADALASTANFLRGHGWQRGGGYQPGQVNFGALQGWNDASVYQRAIAIIGKEIDG